MIIVNGPAVSIANLQESLDSLAEVVLDNCIELDYILARHGCVCTTINSSCYTYINISS